MARAGQEAIDYELPANGSHRRLVLLSSSTTTVGTGLGRIWTTINFNYCLYSYGVVKVERVLRRTILHNFG
jgi:hypothetical protein